MTTPPVRLAIYDMDKTITKVPTFTPFLIHAVRRLRPWRLVYLPLAGAATAAYGLRLIDRARLKELLQSWLIGPLRPADLARVADSFAAATDARNIRDGARQQVAADKAAGYRLVMATASYRLYVEAIAKVQGFDDVIATNTLIGLDSRVLARIDGENCYGPGKYRMVQAWMQTQGLTREDCHIRFYSDHISDEPLFEWADEAIATNPHAALRALATSRGWGVVDW